MILTKTLSIKLNGETRQFSVGTTLQSLLDSLGIKPTRVACEVNMDIIKRAEYPNAVLKDGDTVEIVQMIGGG